MINKKITMLGIGILLVLTLFVEVGAFSYDEDEEGNPFLESEFDVRVPSISIRDLFILQPSSEPTNPELGMVYFDVNSKRLKLYDGTGWYAIALEKVSSVSKEQVIKKIDKRGEVQTCSASTECSDWGDCINNYQSMICITMDESCNKYEDVETKDCVSDFKLESSAKDSLKEKGSSSGGKSTSSKPKEETESEIESGEATSGETQTTVTEETTGTTEKVESEIEGEITESGTEAEETTETTPSDEGEVDSEPEEVKEESEPETAEEAPAEEEVPEELFDITFDLEENTLSSSDKLVVWITLQNFGKRYVPARLIYTITDEQEAEVYRKFEEVRVYSDESLIKTFSDLTLEQGEYNLMLEVEYAGIVEDFELGFSVKTGFWAGLKRFFGGLF